MKESMQIAYSFAKNFAANVLKQDFLEQHEIHVHAPEGKYLPLTPRRDT